MADNGLLDPQTAGDFQSPRPAPQRGADGQLAVFAAGRALARPARRRNNYRNTRPCRLKRSAGRGLRRSELCALQFDHLQEREGRWVIADLIGKHGRVRTVPAPGWCKAAVDVWAEAAQLNSGCVFRPLDKSGRVIGDSLTSQSVFHLVRGYGTRLDVPIAPHDLRRTFAKLAHKGRAALEQIQMSLGHESIITTERYLGVRQDLIDHARPFGHSSRYRCRLNCDKLSAASADIMRGGTSAGKASTTNGPRPEDLEQK